MLDLELYFIMPKELEAFVLNLKNEIKSFNLLEFGDYASQNLLKKENFIFDSDKINYQLLLDSFLFLSLINKNGDIFSKNKIFLKELLEEFNFSEKLINKIFEKNVEDTKNFIFNKVKDEVNCEIRQEKLLNLVKNTVLDKSSLISKIYNSPNEYINLIPKLRNYYLQYYKNLEIEEEKPIYEQKFNKSQIDILLNRDLTNFMKFHYLIETFYKEYN